MVTGKLIINQTIPDKTDEELIFERLKESLEVFEKIIKNNFEITNTRESEIKTILKNIKVTEYIKISDFEKRIISNDIIVSSEQRVKNYNNIFSIINSALNDIRICYLKNNERKRKLTQINCSLDDIADDNCNFSDSLMREGDRGRKYISQFPRNKEKKTKVEICNEDYIIDIDDTLVEYEDISYKKERVGNNQNDNVTTNYTNAITQKNVILVYLE
jgi:hypothetical protein